MAAVGKTCLLLGSRGFLGSQIEKQLQEQGIQVIGSTRRLRDNDPNRWIEFDFPHADVSDCIENLKFDFAIIAARLARANIDAKPSPGNEIAPFRELFSMLAQSDLSGVTYVSSDAVFSGARGQYVETDEPDASEAYGAMQIVAERAISACVPRHLIVRTSFLYDAGDFRKDKRLRRMHEALTSQTRHFGDTNVYKSPVKVSEAARIVVDSTLKGLTGIRHVPAPRKSIYEFFESSIDSLGLAPFREYLVGRESDRPSDTSLRSLH